MIFAGESPRLRQIVSGLCSFSGIALAGFYVSGSLTISGILLVIA
jgi:hypothetical protein